ncbi:MAG: hypothetical protein RLZZ116_1273 [Planctomycetota bacterium]|jgi:hypothetical protein
MTDAAPTSVHAEAAVQSEGRSAGECAVCGEPVDRESGRCYGCGFSQSELERWRTRHADGWRALAKSMRANVTVFWAAFVWMLVGLAFGAMIALGIAEDPSAEMHEFVFRIWPIAGLTAILWATLRMDQSLRGYPSWGNPAAIGLGRASRSAKRLIVPARTNWIPGAGLGSALFVAAIVLVKLLGSHVAGVVLLVGAAAMTASAARAGTATERMRVWRGLLPGGRTPRRVVSDAAAAWIAWCALTILAASSVSWSTIVTEGLQGWTLFDSVAFLSAVIAMLIWVLRYRGAAKELARWSG